jgi:hypothetical protein
MGRGSHGPRPSFLGFKACDRFPKSPQLWEIRAGDETFDTGPDLGQHFFLCMHTYPASYCT